MFGEPIEAVKNGLQMLVTSLRQDPYALETAYVSVITFASEAKQVVPLTELAQFQTPDLVASGTTAMGGALSLLADCIQREVQKGGADQKGDWKPVVFMLSDGAAQTVFVQKPGCRKVVTVLAVVGDAAVQGAGQGTGALGALQ